MNLNYWLREMSTFEPMLLEFLDARREWLVQLLAAVAREAEQAVAAVGASYRSLIEMVQDVDRSASDWVESNFEEAPAVLMVAVMLFMAVTALAVAWGKETIEQQTEEDLKTIEEERTMDDDMLELIKSKLTLTKQIAASGGWTASAEEERGGGAGPSAARGSWPLDDIAVVQDEARKEIIKDALALAILSDRLSVINNIKKEIPYLEKENDMPTEDTETNVPPSDDNNLETVAS